MKHTPWLLLASLLSTACATRFREVPNGLIETGEVVIHAEDGSFSLETGKIFTPPFFARDCLVTATAENYARALKLGARKVRVTVAGKQLYGLLSLCRVHPGATGPATRQYLLQVPSSYVEATSGGRVSVVFEETNASGNYSDGRFYFDAWQLWLSETPFI